MRVLSFDVGIRNLAVCLLEGSATRYKVLQWELIDLCGTSKCSACKSKAACLLDGKHYCKTHAKAAGGQLRPATLTVGKLKAMKKEVLLQTMASHGVVADAKANKADLVLSLDAALARKYGATAAAKTRWTAVSMPLQDVGHAIRTQVGARPWMWDGVDAVCIEKQMKSRMIAVQMMLWMLFTERGVPAHVVSASHKLTVAGCSDVKKRTYKQRKTSSVAVCLTRLDARWRTFFDGHAKKDDLGDCLLQGEWFLENVLSKAQ